ncbi:helix-turn-helix domain-containing protein [Butyrivibrio sp. MC2013]|uniref:helix-turn-helix domain-containing protein n=1 Tax=Butyrivibrio sp. MC2013 TaxID=1280686 RepID=UPI000422029B|nr:helix-turn-helix transcriptional regulator [Butyrivibrio sp. MC2013]
MNNGIGKKIGILRKQKNITQSQLAQYLFVTPQTVSKWEAGNGIPDIALLPKIALFFDVSLDYLFDIADDQRIRDIILKYSVLRDEYSYDMASSMIESVISDDSISEADKAEYYALKSHLLLQKSRDCISKSIEAANKALAIEGAEASASFTMQLYLLRLMNGEYKAVRDEVKKDYKDSSNNSSLYVYLEVLTILEEYEQIIKIVEEKKVIKEASCRDDTFYKICIQYLRALVFLNVSDKAEQLYLELSKIIVGKDLLDMMFLMAKLYSDNNNSKLELIKEAAIDLLEKQDYNSYIKNELLNRINAF